MRVATKGHKRAPARLSLVEFLLACPEQRGEAEGGDGRNSGGEEGRKFAAAGREKHGPVHSSAHTGHQHRPRDMEAFPRAEHSKQRNLGCICRSTPYDRSIMTTCV